MKITSKDNALQETFACWFCDDVRESEKSRNMHAVRKHRGEFARLKIEAERLGVPVNQYEPASADHLTKLMQAPLQPEVKKDQVWNPQYHLETAVQLLNTQLEDLDAVIQAGTRAAEERMALGNRLEKTREALKTFSE